MRSRGFTLIELLVVIAIIGLLAAVILASLGNARGKGADAAVQATLRQASSQAELYAQDHGNSYLGFCDAAQSDEGAGGMSGPGILLGAASSTNATIKTGSTGGTLAIGAETQVTCNDDSAAWTVEAPMYGSAAGAARMWCVDSAGIAHESTSVNAQATSCP